MWKSDIRDHSGRLSDRCLSADPATAVAHFRALLARSDLVGTTCAARLVSPITGGAIYFSRFDREFGDGRIHPDAPIDITADDDMTATATAWKPRASWENDPRPFAEVIREWGHRRGLTRQQQADTLGVPLTTLNGWHAGRPASAERVVRKLMDALK